MWWFALCGFGVVGFGSVGVGTLLLLLYHSWTGGLMLLVVLTVAVCFGWAGWARCDICCGVGGHTSRLMLHLL